jgi:hypothetical protein
MTAQDVLLPMYTTFLSFAGVLLDIGYGFLFSPAQIRCQAAFGYKRLAAYTLPLWG